MFKIASALALVAGASAASSPTALYGTWRGYMIQSDLDGILKEMSIDADGAVLSGGNEGTISATVSGDSTDVTFTLSTTGDAMECLWETDMDEEETTSVLIACGGPGHGNVQSISAAMAGKGPIVTQYFKCATDDCAFNAPSMKQADSALTLSGVGVGIQIDQSYASDNGEWIFEWSDSSVSYMNNGSGDKYAADYEFSADGSVVWTYTSAPDASWVGQISTGVWSQATGGSETDVTSFGFGAPGASVSTFEDAMTEGTVFMSSTCSNSNCDLSAAKF